MRKTPLFQNKICILENTVMPVHFFTCAGENYTNLNEAKCMVEIQRQNSQKIIYTNLKMHIAEVSN